MSRLAKEEEDVIKGIYEYCKRRADIANEADKRKGTIESLDLKIKAENYCDAIRSIIKKTGIELDLD